MNLHILAIGKKKSDYDPFIAHYQKRVTAPFIMSIEILEPLGIDNAVQCKQKESEKLLSKLKNDDYVVALDERGKDFTTVEFSKLIEKQLNASTKRIVFIIGGAYGLDTILLERAQMKVRLGAMTLPHELARLVLSEQLYRITNLLAGGKYHHE
jgi:23S rRNA (pseudouridine1915-N3)-methyltransferase